MKSIKKSNLDYKLKEYIQNDENKLFGICLGMQLFLTIVQSLEIHKD